MADVLEITDQNFESEIINSDKPALVDFWAPWCGPCKMMHPLIEGLSDEMAGKAVVARCNVDENPELAGRFGVTAIPTIVFFKGGQETDKVIGVCKPEELRKRLEA
jgi:thioredoxin 1